MFRGFLSAAALALAILFVPGFQSHAEERQGDQRPIWDRYNSNAAAVRAIKDKPLFGVGWQAWTEKNATYLRQSDDYPLTGTQIEIHNVALSHAAELGLVGLALWAAAFASGIGGAMPAKSIGTSGLSLLVRPPTFSTSWTSSISWPDGVSKRIDSPWPTSSPREIRWTWKPYCSTLRSSSSRSSSCSTLKAKRSIPTRGS